MTAAGIIAPVSVAAVVVSSEFVLEGGIFAVQQQVPDDVLRRQWRHAILADPTGLPADRLQAFARVLGFGDVYACRSIRADISRQPVHTALPYERPPIARHCRRTSYKAAFPGRVLFRS